MQCIDLSRFYENGVFDVVDLFVEGECESLKTPQAAFDQFYRNVFGVFDFFWFDVAGDHVFDEVVRQPMNGDQYVVVKEHRHLAADFLYCMIFTCVAYNYAGDQELQGFSVFEFG